MASRRYAILAATLAASCSNPAAPANQPADFIVEGAGERFVLRLTDAAEIRLADDARLGRNRRFPMGTVRRGNGGFNAPWTWHLEPASVRMVEAAIELCDGRPSYVETNFPDGATYCPWIARIVERK